MRTSNHEDPTSSNQCSPPSQSTTHTQQARVIQPSPTSRDGRPEENASTNDSTTVRRTRSGAIYGRSGPTPTTHSRGTRGAITAGEAGARAGTRATATGSCREATQGPRAGTTENRTGGAGCSTGAITIGARTNPTTATSAETAGATGPQSGNPGDLKGPGTRAVRSTELHDGLSRLWQIPLASSARIPKLDGTCPGPISTNRRIQYVGPTVDRDASAICTQPSVNGGGGATKQEECNQEEYRFDRKGAHDYHWDTQPTEKTEEQGDCNITSSRGQVGRTQEEGSRPSITQTRQDGQGHTEAIEVFQALNPATRGQSSQDLGQVTRYDVFDEANCKQNFPISATGEPLDLIGPPVLGVPHRQHVNDRTIVETKECRQKLISQETPHATPPMKQDISDQAVERGTYLIATTTIRRV